MAQSTYLGDVSSRIHPSHRTLRTSNFKALDTVDIEPCIHNAISIARFHGTGAKLGHSHVSITRLPAAIDLKGKEGMN